MGITRKDLTMKSNHGVALKESMSSYDVAHKDVRHMRRLRYWSKGKWRALLNNEATATKHKAEENPATVQSPTIQSTNPSSLPRRPTPCSLSPVSSTAWAATAQPASCKMAWPHRQREQKALFHRISSPKLDARHHHPRRQRARRESEARSLLRHTC